MTALRRCALVCGVSASLLPIAGLLAVVVEASVGGAPGLAMGFLLLPALGVSVLGWIVAIAAARRRGPVLLVVPISLLLYVAALPVGLEITSIQQDRFWSSNYQFLERGAADVLAGSASIRRLNRDLAERGMLISAVPDRKRRPRVVAFVFDGALGHYSGFAFANTEEPPCFLGNAPVCGWDALENGAYRWWTGDCEAASSCYAEQGAGVGPAVGALGGRTGPGSGSLRSNPHGACAVVRHTERESSRRRPPIT